MTFYVFLWVVTHVFSNTGARFAACVRDPADTPLCERYGL